MAQVNLGRVVGYSAYEIAVQEGFVGTEAEWLASLQGAEGQTGPAGADGDDGTTFTPSVSAEGVISWTNDGGKQNPSPVNIKGPQGQTGPAGQDGSDGAPGQDGAAATIAVGTVTTGNAGTNASVTNSGTSSAAVFDFVIPRGDTGSAGSYSAGNGISIANDEIAVDSTVVALKSDLGDELPPIASGDAGKVLKVNAGETAVEWANDSGGTVFTAGNGLELDARDDALNVLVDNTTIQINGNNQLEVIGGGGTTYTAGDGIVIDENDEISVDYANLDGDKIGNIVDSAWGFGKQNYMVWDGELDADCECQSNDNIYEFDFANCEDDIIGDIGPDTVILGWAGSEEVGDNTVYTWTDDYNTLEAIYVTGTNNFVSMDLVADSSTYQEHDWFEFRFEVINEIPAEFLQIDGTSIVNDRGNLSVDENWVEDIVENIVNPPVNLLRVNIGVQGGDPVIDTNGSSYEMELTVEDKYFVAIVDAELGEALSTQSTYNYFVNTSAGYEMKMSISPTWAEIAGGPAGMYTFTGDDSMVQFAVASDDATTATVRVFFNKPAEPTELPAYSSSDDGKVLTVDSNGDLEWATPAAGGGMVVYESNAEGQAMVDTNGIRAKVLTALTNNDYSFLSNIAIKIGNDFYYPIGKSSTLTGFIYYCIVTNKAERYWDNSGTLAVSHQNNFITFQ